MGTWETVENMQKFYEQCAAFWMRNGDDEDVARCKALWWDIVEVANSFNRWTPAAELFVFALGGYKRGAAVPDEATIRSGNCPPAKTYAPGKRNIAFHDDRLYTVTFTQELNNCIDQFAFACWAQNVADAKRLARTSWETRHAGQRKIPHMFHLEAHRAASQNPEDLRLVNWLGTERAGYDAMWSFVRTRSARRGGGWPV